VSTIAAGGDNTPDAGHSALVPAIPSYPYGIAAAGNLLYVTSGDGNLYKIDLTFTDGGDGGSTTPQPGEMPTAATQTKFAEGFSNAMGIAVDAAGDVYVADYGNHVVKKVATDGTVTVVAGTSGTSGTDNGRGAAARFNQPRGLALNGSDLYVAEYANNAIRKIDLTTGTVTTLAGTPGAADAHADGTGEAARFNGPGALALDPSGNFLWISDIKNRVIRQVTLDGGVVTTYAGPLCPACAMYYNENGADASILAYPMSLTVADGKLLVAAGNRYSVVEITGPGVGSGDCWSPIRRSTAKERLTAMRVKRGLVVKKGKPGR
jgi:sugar lactone lactonase YvrE